VLDGVLERLSWVLHRLEQCSREDQALASGFCKKLRATLILEIARAESGSGGYTYEKAVAGRARPGFADRKFRICWPVRGSRQPQISHEFHQLRWQRLLSAHTLQIEGRDLFPAFNLYLMVL
jgi:hypothetical protein